MTSAYQHCKGITTFSYISALQLKKKVWLVNTAQFPSCARIISGYRVGGARKEKVEQVTRCMVMSEEGDVGEGCGGVAIVGAV